jgi:hypothetical protein
MHFGFLHFWKARLLILVLILKKNKEARCSDSTVVVQVIYFLPSSGDPWHKWKSRSVQKKKNMGLICSQHFQTYFLKTSWQKVGRDTIAETACCAATCAPCAFAFSVSAPCLPACFQWREQFRREHFGCSDDVLTRSARITRVLRERCTA